MGNPHLDREPVPTLLNRARAELAAEFDFARPMRVSRAPGRLDVMGGIADYVGSLVCELTTDRAASVLLQDRPADRELQIFSFNLFDEGVPFTFRMSLDALAAASIDSLRKEFAEPGRTWAGYLAGCLFILHDEKRIDLRNPTLRGLNLALLSTVPIGAGVSSSAAIEVATMMNLVDHLRIVRGHDHGYGATKPTELNAMDLARICQRVENEIVGAPCGIMDQVTSLLGEPGTLLRLVCQPHDLQPPLALPQQTRVIGINSGVKHSVGGGGQYGITRCAAFMAHALIIAKMREMGHAARKTMIADPLSGYLANLNPNDYKKFFRSYLPETMTGRAFLEACPHGTIDRATAVEPDQTYPVQRAADHHVLEARRVRDFAQFLEEAAAGAPGTRDSGQFLDKAGHLMYASHLSYTNDAMLGSSACDVLVDLVKANERAGLYGARITGGGAGGTVAVLCDLSQRADEALATILFEYERQTGWKPESFTGTSAGAWATGTEVAGIS